MDPAQTRFSGHVDISVDVASATDTIWMHGKGLEITRAVYMPENGRNQDLAAAEVAVPGVLPLTAKRAIPHARGGIATRSPATYGELQGPHQGKPTRAHSPLTHTRPPAQCPHHP